MRLRAYFGPWQNLLLKLAHSIILGCSLLTLSTVAFAQSSKLKAKSLKNTKKIESSQVVVPAVVLPPQEQLEAGSTRTYFDDKANLNRSYFGQLRLESMQYFTELPDSPHLTSSQLLTARISGVGHFETAKWLEYAGDISAGTFFTQHNSTLTVSEIYVSALLSKSVLISAGRKKYLWSEMDSRWQMGLWQPYYAFDALRPDELGLTGVSLDISRPGFHFVALVSPIFIPSMGPQIREEDGGLVSDSRWYRAPSREYNFNNRINTLIYRLSIPDTAKLVGNPGTAFKGSVGDPEAGLWGNASVAYKPVNELLLRRQSFKNTSAPKVDVTVSPDVTYHSIHSADLGYTVDNIKAFISYIEDDPKEKMPDEDWVIQKVSSLRAYSANLDMNMRNLFSRPVQVQLGYLKVYGAEIQDITSAGLPDDTTLFNQRLKFTDALSIKFQGQITSVMKKPLVTKFRYLYDYDQRGSLLSTEFMVYPVKDWAILMGADLLGVDSDSSPNPSWFLNQFRANDRVYGGMTYVF